MLLSSLILLIACGGDSSKESNSADTSDTSGSTDTGVTDDTSNPTDTSDTSGGDTSDTSDTGEVETPVCDTLTPYRGCEATASYSTSPYVYDIVWDADGRLMESSASTDASRGTLLYRVVYLYTDGLLTEILQLDASGDVQNSETFTYDADGNQLTWQGDGFLRTYTYDDEGRVLTIDEESRGNSSFCTRTWTSTATGDDYEESCETVRGSERHIGSQDSRGLETDRSDFDTSGATTMTTSRVWRADCQLERADYEFIGRPGISPSGTNSEGFIYDADNRMIGSSTVYVTEGGGADTVNYSRTYTSCDSAGPS